MKSLVLKDFYNVSHSLKSLLFILIVFLCLIPTIGVSGYIFLSAFFCSTMITTTFSFDDTSKWSRYAVIMPVSRNELIISKFIVLILFSAIGSIFGLVVGTTAGVLFGKFTFSFSGMSELLHYTLLAFLNALIFGSATIPLSIKFGVQKSQILRLVAFIVPAFLVYTLLTLSASIAGELSITITTDDFGQLTVFSFLYLIFTPLWCYLMYKISTHIFEKQEL